ncbi:MAG TPA: hypothetical protein PLB04_13565 [Nitrospira sp.]|nr:hypothetical protein [Nitrospira sp.]
MSIDAINRHSPAASGAVSSSQGANSARRAELQARQAEELARQRQAEQATPQPGANAQGQPIGTLINTFV